MSASDVEAVSAMYEAFNRGEYEAATEMLHEDAELHQPPELPGADTYKGRAEFVRGLSGWHASFEPGFQYALNELVDAPRGVFMRLRTQGRGRVSGAEVAQDSFNVWEVRGGKPFRCRIFNDEGEARAAAGL